MYGSDLVVGGRSLESVEQALRSVLPTLGLEVTRLVDVANVSERYEVTGQASSISFGTLDRGVFGIAVRGPRAPHWNNELARRLSQALGGFSASRVSDRLYDDYGYGYFLDGHSVEARIDANDEDHNNRQFLENIGHMTAPLVSPWPPRGAFRVLFVEGDARIAPVPPPPCFVLAVATNYKERIDLAGEELSIALDEEERRALIVRSALSPDEVMAALRAEEATAFVSDGTRRWAGRDGVFDEVKTQGLPGLLKAWAPVHERSWLYLLDVTYPPLLSPYR